jgi:hypothetical protein
MAGTTPARFRKAVAPRANAPEMACPDSKAYPPKKKRRSGVSEAPCDPFPRDGA